MLANSKYPQSVRDEAVALYLSGKTGLEVECALMGKYDPSPSCTTIMKWVPVRHRRAQKPRKGWPRKVDVAVMKQMVGRKIKPDAIARRFGCSASYIRELCRNHGIPSRYWRT